MLRKRARAAAVAATLPLDVLFKHVLPFIPRAVTLQAFAHTCKAGCARVRELGEEHYAQLNGGMCAHRLPPPLRAARMPHLALEPLRALHLVAHGRCELCGRANVQFAFRSNWNMLVHDRCLKQQVVNAYHLSYTMRDKLRAAQAPCLFWTVGPYEGRAHFWARCTSSLVPIHWTVEGLRYFTMDEAAALGSALPSDTPPAAQRRLAQQLAELP